MWCRAPLSLLGKTLSCSHGDHNRKDAVSQGCCVLCRLRRGPRHLQGHTHTHTRCRDEKCSLTVVKKNHVSKELSGWRKIQTDKNSSPDNVRNILLLNCDIHAVHSVIVCILTHSRWAQADWALIKCRAKLIRRLTIWDKENMSFQAMCAAKDLDTYCT